MRTVALYEMLFGMLTLTGGVIGYVQVGSVYSLVAGLVAGVILVLAALKMQKGARSGMYVCLVVTILLLAKFARDFFFLDARFMPAGLMTILGILSLLLILILFVQPAERKRIF
jgi:uncharacterized membrane protein (UPF0136 family)